MVYFNFKEFICKICGKVFKKEGNLVRYEVLYKFLGFCICFECGKNFLFSYDLWKYVFYNYIKMDLKKVVDGCKFDKDVNIMKGFFEKCYVRDIFYCYICKMKFFYIFIYLKYMWEKYFLFKVVRCGICLKVCNDKCCLVLYMVIRY